MPKGGKRRLRMNRAVGLWNKADEFQADPEQVQSLVGAGYADVVSDPVPEKPNEGEAHFTMDVLTGSGDDGEVPGKSGPDEAGPTPARV
jgi:hypothetical protein